MAEQIEFIPASPPVPAGNTASWYTPRAWFLAQERKLIADGLIPSPTMLDPFGSTDAPVSREIVARGGRVFTFADDGLTQAWAGVPFVNPDYQHAPLELACARTRAAIERREVPGAWGLLPAWPDRGWWHREIEPGRESGAILVRFWKGRLRFGWPGNPEGLGGDGAKFPSVVVIWRGRP